MLSKCNRPTYEFLGICHDDSEISLDPLKSSIAPRIDVAYTTVLEAYWVKSIVVLNDPRVRDNA